MLEADEQAAKNVNRRTFLRRLLASGAAGAATFYLAGCDAVLDLDPMGTVVTDDFYQSESDALAAVAAAYDPLQSWGLVQEGEWEMGDVMSDDAINGLSRTWGAFATFDATTSNLGALQRWSPCWRGIYRANLGIERLPEASVSSEGVQERAMGELYYLRAQYYFILARSFGGAPLVTRPLRRSELQQARAPVGEVYSQIVEDLVAAEERLPWEYASDDDVGRATRGAAKALRGKAHLYQENWSEAATAFQEVVDAEVYALVDEYANLFGLENENNVESVFEVQFSTFPGEWTEITASQAPGGQEIINPSRGRCQPTQELVDAYEEGDPRRDATVLSAGDEFFGSVYDPGWSNTGYNAKKHLVPMSAVAGNAEESPINYMLMRYADVLLMLAEARNEEGDVGAAETHVNAVRSRAGMPPVQGGSQSSMRDAIRHERRVELGLEAKRFFDLVRWGIASEELEEAGFVEGQHEVLPIPQSEIDLIPELEQNPGW